MTGVNPTGKHRRKRRHHGEGTVVERRDRWRAKPWAAVVPYLDESGRRREMWLSAGSKAEAEELRKSAIARIRKGVVPTHETVGDYVTAWLGTIEVGPGTWPTYKAHVTERIVPSFGGVALDRLTPQMVRSAVAGWQGAPATRGGTLRLLRAAMRQAVADRRIEHDPTAGIQYPRIPKHRPTTLTGEQARHLIATVQGERFAPILVVSLGLGLRRGEALGLRVQDVNLQGRTVTIAKSLRYIAPELRADGEDPYRLTATKTGDVRTLPLPKFVEAALRERLEERGLEQRQAKVYAPNGFVFADVHGNNIAQNTLHGWFERMLERADLPHLRWHDLRGSTATLLIEAGENLETVRRILGHRDIATTLRYIGETPAALRAAADRINEAMG